MDNGCNSKKYFKQQISTGKPGPTKIVFCKKKRKTITWEKFMLFAIAIDEKLNFKKYVSIISKKGKNHLNPVCRIANVYIKKKIKCK